MYNTFTRGEAVSPSNSALITKPYRALFVCKAAATSTDLVDVAVQFTLGTTVTLRVPSGVILPIVPKRVMATGTTADVIVGLQE